MKFLFKKLYLNAHQIQINEKKGRYNSYAFSLNINDECTQAHYTQINEKKKAGKIHMHLV